MITVLIDARSEPVDSSLSSVRLATISLNLATLQFSKIWKIENDSHSLAGLMRLKYDYSD